MKYPNLFNPGRINGMTVRNRIIMPPMGTGMMDLTGEPNDKLIELFARRARGGAGMLITEPLFTEIPSAALRDMPVGIINPLGAGQGKPKLYDWAEAVQSYGARMCAALSPLPTRWMLHQMQISTQQRMDELEREVFQGLGIFNKLTTAEIEGHIASFAKGAGILKGLGFDAIEINFSMIIDYFTLKPLNKRTDRYAFENNSGMRFVQELIEETRKAVGREYPLMLMLDADMYTPGWRTIEDTRVMAKQLEAWTIDCIRCRAGTSIQMQYDTIPYYMPKGAIAYLAAAVKDVVKIPVVANGRLADPDVAEKVLAEGKADFISIGRGLLADPDLPNKIRSGNADRVRKCLSCNIGCMSNLMVHPMKPFRCTVNPLLGNEELYREIGPAETKKKVVIAGGGPAGMSATLTALKRGHNVVLFEREKRIGDGGFFKLACIPPFKQENAYVAEYYSRELWGHHNLRIRAGVTASLENVLSEKPDVVMIATGARSKKLDIAGSDSPVVVSVDDILLEGRPVGDRIVVVGGGGVGCETAHFLALRGKKVTILEMLPRIANEVVHPNRNCLVQELQKCGVQTLLNTKVTAVAGNMVRFEQNGKESTISADNIVFATGAESESSLYTELCGKVPLIEIIGDARKPRQIIDAVREGFFTAMAI
jgi:2,4-dienoyl-CoA reductase-like NADH-dependent reductase (Old Yellow Enzyme family)/thioredoxin reductase